MGSSPLARGAHEMSFQPPVGAGLIPARAGSTRCLRARNFPLRAHPRSRGEHMEAAAMTQIPAGSSPLARGARAVLQACIELYGLIPARAGSTLRGDAYLVVAGAHPRSRGEHSWRMFTSQTHRGSSPLARGALDGGIFTVAWVGLIPARAGSTGLLGTASGIPWAHPRSRGEHQPSSFR